jgi:hypothetical protein
MSIYPSILIPEVYTLMNKKTYLTSVGIIILVILVATASGLFNKQTYAKGRRVKRQLKIVNRTVQSICPAGKLFKICHRGFFKDRVKNEDNCCQPTKLPKYIKMSSENGNEKAEKRDCNAGKQQKGIETDNIRIQPPPEPLHEGCPGC